MAFEFADAAVSFGDAEDCLSDDVRLDFDLDSGAVEDLDLDPDDDFDFESVEEFDLDPDEDFE